MTLERHPQMPDEEKPCYLSALAPELFENILSHLDSVRTLSNLITTSRFVFRHFVGREGPIILRILQNELGPVLTDAKFLNRLRSSSSRTLSRN
ncbi:hypothetical protein QBC33DRAFT_41386 [Phialemonium atrogriseum]|uniref:F-box domain-containing protein n=1 Tax=Phialemonium atrogriseum TaxID=1093897 RepID=A0AAJ0C0P7_9PEZI|nr:uncharacterized protein QBC33DRAFT_41386 [Phialemonium atrogriseum]KAK1768008.1 hypothetical protein QBC33DRAFT_41386 [Phialemonium atrogriseum]